MYTMIILLLLGFCGSLEGMQPAWNQGFFSIEGMTGDSMYSGGQSRGQPVGQPGGQVAQQSAPSSQRRQDAGFQNQGFSIPFRSDFTFNEFGSPFGSNEGFQQFLSGLGTNTGTPSDFSQQSQPQFQIPNLGQLNQRRSSDEIRRPQQTTFKREVTSQVRPGGQVARQLDRDFVRPRPVYVPAPTQSPVFQTSTSFNYGFEEEEDINRNYRQPVYKPEYTRPEYKQQEYKQQEYKQQEYKQYNSEYSKPQYTSAYKTTKKPTKLSPKKPSDTFVKPFDTEDFKFEAQKFDIKKEVSQSNQENPSGFFSEDHQQGHQQGHQPGHHAADQHQPESAGFYHHENLKNHKLETFNRHEDSYPGHTERPEQYYEKDYYSSQGNQDAFFSEEPKDDFFSGPPPPSSGDSYSPPKSYPAPPPSKFSNPPTFSTTIRNEPASFFTGADSEPKLTFNQNQEYYKPPTSYPQPEKEDKDPKGAFKPPTLVERFSIPVVEPSIPFQPPEAVMEDKPEHQEQHEYSGSPSPPVQRYAESPAVPTYVPQVNKPKAGKKPILSKKPLVPEHKYEQKNYRKPVVAPSSTSDEHPIMRVSQNSERKQAPAEFRNLERPSEFKNAFRRMDGPVQGFPAMEPQERSNAGQLEIEEVTRQKPAEYRMATENKPKPIEYDNNQEIITLDRAKGFTSDSGPKTFTVKASFSPSLNPEDISRTGRGAMHPAHHNRRGGPRVHNVRIKNKTQNASHNKKHRFMRRN